MVKMCLKKNIKLFESGRSCRVMDTKILEIVLKSGKHAADIAI